VASDQGLKYNYVLDGNDEVRYRRVATGPLQEDGLRVIAEGPGPSDRGVGGGLQQLHPGTKVRAESVAMPTIGPVPPEHSSPPSPGPGNAPARKASTTKG
jgi:multidrug efflux system membrane fusion protein